MKLLNPQSINHNCSRQQSSIFLHYFSEKVRLDVSSESSARQRIHLKHQALFFSKDKSKKLKCCLLQFLFGAFRVNFKAPKKKHTDLNDLRKIIFLENLKFLLKEFQFVMSLKN